MSRAVIQPFEEYQRARIIFVQTVAALAGGKDNKNVELLHIVLKHHLHTFLQVHSQFFPNF